MESPIRVVIAPQELNAAMAQDLNAALVMGVVTAQILIKVVTVPQELNAAMAQDLNAAAGLAVVTGQPQDQRAALVAMEAVTDLPQGQSIAVVLAAVNVQTDGKETNVLADMADANAPTGGADLNGAADTAVRAADTTVLMKEANAGISAPVS